MHVKIEQNNTAIEEVNGAVIDKLYQLAKRNVNGLDNSSNLVGRLHTTATYQEYIDFLTQQFQDLYINADKYYIAINDPEVERICANQLGDGIGVTQQDITNVPVSFVGNFRGNANILDLSILEQFVFNPPLQSEYSAIHIYTDKLENLKKIYVPSVFTIIGNANDTSPYPSLEQITMPNVQIIDRSAFRGCSNLQMTSLPDSVTTIGFLAFYDSSVSISDTNNVTKLDSQAFRNCQNITSITIRNKCEFKGNSLFNNCSNLETVIFEQGSGPELAFYNEGSWGDGMFVNTKITKLDLPERITNFGNASLNCSTLRTLIIRRNTPPERGSWSLNKNVQIYVPDDYVDTYKNSWTDVASRIHPISEYVE